MRIAVIVLGAGSSSRMKTSKQLLAVGDTTLLGVVLEKALQSDGDGVFCVLGANAEVIRKSINTYDVEVIVNPNFKNGLSSSIQSGIRYVSAEEFDAVVILLGDQPKVSTSYIDALIQAFKEDSKSIWASKYPLRKGVPAIFPKKIFNQLLHISGDKGANELLNNPEISVKTISKSINLEDIDTPEDYNKFTNS